MRARVFEIKVGGFKSEKTHYVTAMSMMRIVNACIDKYHLRYGFLKPFDMRCVNDIQTITVYDDKKRCFIKEVTDDKEITELFNRRKVVSIENYH